MKRTTNSQVPIHFGLRPGECAERVGALLTDLSFIYPGDVLVSSICCKDEALAATDKNIDPSFAEEARFEQAVPDRHLRRRHCEALLQWR